MNDGCFQSVSSCGKYPYIGDLYLQSFFLYCFIFYEKIEASILVKIFLEATFSGILLTESFLREQIHSENLYENHLYDFSGRFDVHL